MKAVTMENLSKVYPSGKRALNRVNLSIGEGEIFGFLGPNGAGKTTAIKLLNGMLQPSEGMCAVFGMDPGAAPEQVHMISGVVTEHAQMYNKLTGIQNLLFFCAMFGIGADDSKRRSMEALEQLALLGAKDQKLAEYSTGMRQRLTLARAMLHQPRILFLDEPTSGLDPESVMSVNNLIKNLAKEKGATVFLCTHQLRYAEEICTGYGLISEGSMLATGTLEELRALCNSGLTVTVKSDTPPRGIAINREGEYMYFNVDSEEDIPGLIKQIVDDGGKIYHVTVKKPSLEEIYFKLIEIRGAEHA